MIVLFFFAAVAGGAVAAISGFGIGSILTPTVASAHPANVAVAVVAIPHFVATAVRLWLVREHIDWQLLKSFGVMSAVGGILGAIFSVSLEARWLEITLAILLLFVGLGGLLGFTSLLKFRGPLAWIAGGISGFLGGLVGNQGGLRAGAMTGLDVSRDAFVATGTAVGLAVDLARLPVYAAVFNAELVARWQLIVLLSAGCLVGTWMGIRILKQIPNEVFLHVVRFLLIGLAIYLVFKP